MLVDSDHEVSETLESNNSKRLDWSPATVQGPGANGSTVLTDAIAQPS
jgi:hypothetical protein